MQSARLQRLTILGSTGSIGASTLDVVARHPDRFDVFALTGYTRVAELAAQCERFRPQVAVVRDASHAADLAGRLKKTGSHTEVLHGVDALCAVASANECDTVMAAIVGAAGLASTLAAARAGKKLLLANKEALVMSGRLLIDAVADSGAALLPIDSEHNAVFQCLPHDFRRHAPCEGVARVLLTASGGPFLKRAVDTLDDVTPDEAVAHPNWVMGRKISVDSATMMNKGLEVIEAHWLFGLPAERIEVVIHPQSVIHSMVSYVDGSVLAQLGNPDMRTPIAHALAYPERIGSGVAPLDLASISRLDFQAPDFNRFPCLALAYDALGAGGSAPAVMNAANEIAVDAFLSGRIGFREIDRVIHHVMQTVAAGSLHDLDTLFERDRAARDEACRFVHACSR